MAKRRNSTGGEVSLFPFLSILACLIGALIMIIVVLCVAQTQQSDGRSKEELAQAREYQELLKQEKEQNETKVVLEENLKKLEKLRIDIEAKEKRAVMLRKLLSSSDDIKKTNTEMSQNLLKELDNLLVEIEGLTKQDGPLKKEIAALMAEIQKREPPKKKELSAVVVQPGGSGLAKGTKVFFVEASGGKLTIYWDAKQKAVLSSADEVIATDVAFNHLLKEVLKVPNAKIIFLLRDDGMTSFNRGAGWAQATYGYRTEQIGKLPIPGRGEIDLKMFNEYLGTMAPPVIDPAAPIPPTPPKL
ncbi:hypothetical protein BH11VER1_BH11VER1_13410 [soil metagenome]